MGQVSLSLWASELPSVKWAVVILAFKMNDKYARCLEHRRDPKSAAVHMVPTSLSNDSINKEALGPRSVAFLFAFPVSSCNEYRRL